VSAPLEPWLEERLAAAPAELRERMVVALRRSRGVAGAKPGDARALAQRLRAIGEHLVGEAASGTPSAGTALTLLAADAFATLACESLAEADPAALGEVE
jgi:hypothetical protein